MLSTAVSACNDVEEEDEAKEKEEEVQDKGDDDQRKVAELPSDDENSVNEGTIGCSRDGNKGTEPTK